MKGKYITEAERYKIEAWLQAKIKPKEIAKLLDKSLATVYNEIKRGMTEQLDGRTYKMRKVYFADVAQNKYLKNRENKGINLKIGNDMELVRYIETEIKEKKRSPEAVIGAIKSHGKKFQTTICYKTLYNYIDRGLFLGISNSDLPVKKEGKKRSYHKVRVSLKNKTARLIDERPEEILKRKEFGHWEMDTVQGGTGKGKACLLVLSERMTRKELIFKMPSKHAKNVVKVLDRMERRMGLKTFRKYFKTITVDNGTEFSDTKGMERHKRTVIYYCHPYSSWERGTNENINKMIRRFIPKGASIEQYTNADIQRIQDWINDYPRGIHGFLSANEVYERLLSA